MTNYQRIAKYIIENYNEGEVLSYKDITDRVHGECGINRDSILPSDYCNNHGNRDPYAGKYYIFHRIGDGQYKVLSHEEIIKSCKLE